MTIKILQEHTERYVRMILDKMKEERLFASQGGPIILGQVTTKKRETYIFIYDLKNVIK